MWRESNSTRRRTLAALLPLVAIATMLCIGAGNARAGGSGSTSGVLPHSAAQLGGSRYALQMAAATVIGAGGIHRAHP